MNPATIIYAGGGVVKNNNNQYLLIFRNNRWDLPKGKLEPNETIEKCATREVCEECGLNIQFLTISHFLIQTSHNYILDKKNIQKLTSWFAMDYTGPQDLTPQTEEGITQVGWFTATDAAKLIEESYPTIQDVFSHIK